MVALVSGFRRAAVAYPLEGLVVVDATSGVAGQFAGRLLADWGADVTLVEPPGGTPTRRLAPLSPSRDFSYLFWNLNAGKGAVTADLSCPAGQARLAGLCEHAGVVLHDRGAGLPGTVPPSAITCEIADFPASGPYAGWQGTEMI